MSGPKIIAACIATVAIFAIGISITASVWNECRADGHSFFYCMRLVSK